MEGHPLKSASCAKISDPLATIMIKSLFSFTLGILVLLGVLYYFAPNATKSTVKSMVAWVSSSGGKGDEILSQ